MEDIFTINVDEEAFEKIVNGKKTIHLSVNNKKNKVFAVGNQISFIVKTEEGDKTQKAVIENLFYFNTISEAIDMLGKEQCGFKPSATFEKASDVFLSEVSYEDIEKYGIVAIVFKTEE